MKKVLIAVKGSYIGSNYKVFGNLMIDKEYSRYKQDYCIYDLKESLKVTEEKLKPHGGSRV